MSDQAVHTKEDWGWRNFGSGPVLVAEHGRRSAILAVGAHIKGGREVICTNVDGILREIDPNHPDALLIRAAPNLARASASAYYAVQSLLAYRGGPTDELLTDVGASLVAALQRAGVDTLQYVRGR